MPTLIEPNELAGLNVSTYFKMLNKDLAKLSRVGKNQPFVYFRDFKLAGKKIPLILFVDPSKEKEWDAVLNKIPKENFKKQATGIARISIEPDDDGNGKDDVQIKIKKCEGISKADVASEIKNGWFAKDPDVEVRTAKDDEADETDEEQDNEVKTQIENQNSTQTDKLDELDYETVEKAQVNKEFKNYLAEVRATVGMIGGANEFQAGIKSKLQEFAQAKPSTTDEKLEFIKAVKTYDAELDEKMNHLSETVVMGNKMLKKQESFLKAIFKAQEYQTSRAQISEHIANLTRLLQFAAKANDYLDNVLVGKGEATKDIAEVSKALSQDIPEEKAILKALADLPKLGKDASLKELQDASLQQYQVIVMLQKYDIFEGNAKKMWKDAKEGKNVEAYKAKFAKTTKKEDLTKEIEKQYKATEENIKIAAGTTIEQAIMQMVGDDATPDKIYDAFYSYFRGKVTYSPNKGTGNLCFGQTIGNCNVFNTTFQYLLKKYQFETSSEQINQPYITQAIDGEWLDPNSPGNLIIGGNKHYYFTQHFMLKCNGKVYCTTTGRTGANALVGAAWKNLATLSTLPTEFEKDGKNYKVEDKPTNGYQYLLTEL
jgi:hypothetical protein